MSPYTILTTDDYIFVDTSDGPVTLLLPDPTAFGYCKDYHLIDARGTFATNNCTLTPFAAEKIEGLAASKVFQTAWGGWTIATNKIDWYSY
jgi:hypothetical protein